MPDAVLLCAIKWPDIGIHLGTIGLSREEKEEREKSEPGIGKPRKAGKSWKNLTCWQIFSQNAGFFQLFLSLSMNNLCFSIGFLGFWWFEGAPGVPVLE